MRIIKSTEYASEAAAAKRITALLNEVAEIAVENGLWRWGGGRGGWVIEQLKSAAEGHGLDLR